MTAAHDTRPVLWHLAMSHYNEKARWALDYKRVSHVRRAVMPGLHVPVAQRLGGGETFPVLTIGDEVFGDSTDIIAALEERWPEPALYPQDTGERSEALAIEDEYDRVMAPALRAFLYQHLLPDRAAAARFLSHGGPPWRRPLAGAIVLPLRPVMRKVFEIPGRDDDSLEGTVREVMARLDERVAGREFLVGDAFSVADLTVCSILFPVACPDAMPGPPLPPFPQRVAELSAELRDTPAGRWVADTYRTWRTA